MATAYQSSRYSNYPVPLRDSPADSAYQSDTATSSYGRSYAEERVRGSRLPSTMSNSAHSNTIPLLSNPHSTSRSNSLSQVADSCNQQSPDSTRSRYPANNPPTEEPKKKSNTSDIIRANLQIPKSISDNGGSLAEFAAQITCLFWFESIETLKRAEQLSPASSPMKRLEKEAIPSSGFRKWVVTILSTTQVTDNVIILALLFIYRLKTLNKSVKGRSGSEYRLLTVALMLGNKFLDDNTYTNKTWAEVSGISVTEIHVMEVEFLSNMRYSLLASKEQWGEWHRKLRKFRDYCELASKVRIPLVSPQSALSMHPSLSPPLKADRCSPPSNTYLVNYGNPNSHHWPAQSPLKIEASSPLSSMPDLFNRKRSYDHDSEEPAAKRVTRPSTTLPIQQYPSVPMLPPRADAPRLPVPNLTISTSQPTSGHNGPSVMSQNLPLLPPLSGRAMPSIYPPASAAPNWAPQPQLPLLTPNAQHHPSNGYSTPTRRHSPHSVQELLSYGSSPTSAHFQNHNPGHISPSVYLQERPSPYKPVRHVNALNYPPTSTSMSGYSVNADQMHYQPLGKRNDYRSGLVPEYASQQHFQNWPHLPQPNFHA